MQSIVRRLAISLVVALTAVGVVAGTASPASAAYSGSVFNNPYVKSKQRVNARQLVANIDAVPRGAEINVSTFNLNEEPVVSALIRAHRRAVHVHFVGWDFISKQPQYRRLQKALGTNQHRRSWVATCRGSCRVAGKDHRTHHAKVVTFSRIGSGAAARHHVVMIFSGNLTRGAGTQSWNEHTTIVGDAKLYGSMRGYVLGSRLDRNGFNYPAVSSGAYRIDYSPRTDRYDPVLAALNQVRPDKSCRIRITMYIWRQQAQAKRLSHLRKRGCDVRVAVTGYYTTRTVKRILRQGKIPAWDAAPTGHCKRCIYLHMKTVVIQARMGAKRQDVVFTRTKNFTDSGDRWNTEITLRLSSKREADARVKNFGVIVKYAKKLR